MQNKILLMLVIITLAAVNVNAAACGDRHPEEETGIEKVWNDAKCSIKKGAEKVGDFAEDAYHKTKEAAKSGITTITTGAKKGYNYVKDAVSEDTKHESSEEKEDDAKVVPLAGGGSIPDMDLDVRGPTAKDETQKTVKGMF